MADDRGRYRRGRYKEYLRHHNPYKFEAARRKNRRLNRQKADSCSAAHQSGVNDKEPEIDSGEFEVMCACDESTLDQWDVFSSEETAVEKAALSSDEQMQEILKTRDLGLDRMLDLEASDDEQWTTTSTSYERFLREDDDASLHSVSDYEDQEDLELPSENCESESDDDILYPGAPLTSSSSVVLLLTFVMKHKLTREAFNDLLSVIEAHCPRPNNCKTSVKKLLEFVSQAKGDIEKHYFCDYCKAYFGKGTGNCNICGRSISKASRFFIEVPVEKQLQKFFTGKYFVFCE